MNERLTHEEQQVIRKTIYRLHEQGWGLAFGLVFGLTLLVATNVLVFKGGSTVGPHLALLGVYFPGYRVTVVGSLIGFVYAFVVGYGFGRMITTVYNRMTSR
jgi:tetrahydromethanopterin S-methyltransferase subunit G